MIIVLHLLNDNQDRVTGFYCSSECDVSLLVHTFRKQTWPNIREHMIQIGLQSLQTWPPQAILLSDWLIF
jgi:hypothetical protein